MELIESKTIKVIDLVIIRKDREEKHEVVEQVRLRHEEVTKRWAKSPVSKRNNKQSLDHWYFRMSQ